MKQILLVGAAAAAVLLSFAPGVTAQTCGNGVVEVGELCDDGNLIDGDGCDSNCTPTACGNGIVVTTTGEMCDDGNQGLGDECRPDCTLELCGDGIDDPYEECDDGNTTPGDGCDASCMLEAYDAFNDGELVRETSDPRVHVMYGGAKFAIPDTATFDAMSFDGATVEVVPDGALSAIQTVPEDGTVLQEFSNPAVWIVTNGARSLIPDFQTFMGMGFELDDIFVVPDGTLAQISTVGAVAEANIPARSVSGSQGVLARCRHHGAFKYVGNRCRDCDGQCDEPGEGRCLQIHKRCVRVTGRLTAVPKSNLDDADLIFNINPDRRQLFHHYRGSHRWNYNDTPLDKPGNCNPREWRGDADREQKIDNRCELHLEIIAADRPKSTCGTKLCPQKPDKFENVACRPGCTNAQECCDRPAYARGTYSALGRCPRDTDNNDLPTKLQSRRCKPNTGPEVRVIGPGVTDNKHTGKPFRGWPEIHPVWYVEILHRATRAAAAPPFPADPRPTYRCSTLCCDKFQERDWPAQSEDECTEHGFDLCAQRGLSEVRRIRFDGRKAFREPCEPLPPTPTPTPGPIAQCSGGQVCGTYTLDCNPNFFGTCACVSTDPQNTAGVCMYNYSCGTAEDCSASPCPAGKTCYYNTCCGFATCGPQTCTGVFQGVTLQSLN